MKMKSLPTLDELRLRRLDILNLTAVAQTNYMKAILYSRLKSVNRDLYTITKNPIYT